MRRYQGCGHLSVETWQSISNWQRAVSSSGTFVLFTIQYCVTDNAELVIRDGCVMHNFIIQENDSAATGAGLMISVIWQDAAQVTTAVSIVVLSETIIKCVQFHEAHFVVICDIPHYYLCKSVHKWTSHETFNCFLNKTNRMNDHQLQLIY